MGCSTTSSVNEKSINNLLFKVSYDNEASIGFLCKIPFPSPSDLFPILIITKNIFKEKEDEKIKDIKLILNNNLNNSYTIVIGENRIYYRNKNLSIIEIKKMK